MIRVPAEWAAAIRREGEAAYPDECCGILLGRLLDDDDGRQGHGQDCRQSGQQGRRVLEALLPIGNAREPEERYHRFRIEPEDLMRAEKEARKQGRDVLGFYHSHPDHPARPSDFDREHALPFYSYIITRVEQGRAEEITSWELAADRSEFLREEIEEGIEEEGIEGGETWR
ncbi:MAG: M67 family metallopeptidase [Spirochaetaceae bacterium]|jgi:proteasome lid subunit RPN8/RPN11|nr:M67 family metallopeptidase [Spirochaetaceae bacterium]